ncbi:MAG: SRPBCC family protein [Alphaproteobacteria bacterium]|nr:SRPBCC family protein [Alphaproteobacteria bacterium]
MSGALKVAGAVVVVALVGLGVVVSMQPDDMRVERSIHVDATPEVTFDQMDDFESFASWSPWGDLDPEMHTEMSDATSGVGATYYWKGNSQVGEGRMTIVEVEPGKMVRQKLEFMAPWEAENEVVFGVTPDGDGSTATWTMTGHNDFVAKMAGLFMDMDGMIGADFSKGLARIKDRAEADAKRIADEKAAAEAAAAEAAAAEAAAQDAMAADGGAGGPDASGTE